MMSGQLCLCVESCYALAVMDVCACSYYFLAVMYVCARSYDVLAVMNGCAWRYDVFAVILMCQRGHDALRKLKEILTCISKKITLLCACWHHASRCNGLCSGKFKESLVCLQMHVINS